MRAARLSVSQGRAPNCAVKGGDAVLTTITGCTQSFAEGLKGSGLKDCGGGGLRDSRRHR